MYSYGWSSIQQGVTCKWMFVTNSVLFINYMSFTAVDQKTFHWIRPPFLHTPCLFLGSVISLRPGNRRPIYHFPVFFNISWFFFWKISDSLVACGQMPSSMMWMNERRSNPRRPWPHHDARIFRYICCVYICAFVVYLYEDLEAGI